MNNKLENLPNEMLIEIFRNLDVQDLFQAFYNLNIRFNRILYSLNNLSLTISKFNYSHFNPDDLPLDGISTLIISGEVHIDLERFKNIRCLVMSTLTFAQIKEFNDTQYLDDLEHLSINFSKQSFPYTISGIINKIFSNRYPCIQSCYLPAMETIKEHLVWTKVLSLRKLIVGKMNIFTFKMILTTCPNLYFLKFIQANSNQIPLPSQPHNNLKRMIIVSPLWSSNKQSDIKNFLSYVPNLERLTIHYAEFAANMKEYLTNDWLASSIMSYLPAIHCFKYYLAIFYFGLVNTSEIEDSLNQIKEDFKKAHNNKYQSQLILIQQL